MFKEDLKNNSKEKRKVYTDLEPEKLNLNVSDAYRTLSDEEYLKWQAENGVLDVPF